MVYASISVRDLDTGHRYEVKILAETSKAVDDYVDSITSSGQQVTGLFIDTDPGSVQILPEDFDY